MAEVRAASAAAREALSALGARAPDGRLSEIPCYSSISITYEQSNRDPPPSSAPPTARRRGRAPFDPEAATLYRSLGGRKRVMRETPAFGRGQP